MADGMSLEIDNLAAWLAELNELPNVIRERVVKGAVATGASVIRKEYVARAPMWTGDVSKGHPPPGTLKRSVYQTRLVEFCTPTAEVWKVDVRRGATARNRKGERVLEKDAFYALWVEYGHYVRTPGMSEKEHRRARSGVDLYTGSKWVPARPFARPAFEAKKQEALNAMAAYLSENLSLATASMRYVRTVTGATAKAAA